MAQRYGVFEWKCPICGKYFRKNTPQGLGLAKSNHERQHWREYHQWERDQQEKKSDETTEPVK